MDPSIDAARAMLPAWAQWANVASHVPVAYAATLLAVMLGAAVSTAPGDRASAVRAANALALLLPLGWAGAAATAAGPIGRTPWWLLSLLAAASSLVAATLVRVTVRRRVRRLGAGEGPPSRQRALRGIFAGIALTLAVAAPLRAFAGQAWSRDLAARVFAVAFTGGHDRTLADLAWVTAQRGDQAGAAVLLRAAMVAEGSAVPAANLAIVLVNVGQCREAAEAVREARRRVAAGGTVRERGLMRLAVEAMRSCQGRDEPAPVLGGS